MLFIESKLQQVYSDEDAVYLTESVVGGLYICKMVRSPTVCRAFNLHAKTETMTVLLRVFRCRSSYGLSGSWPSRVVWKAVLLLVASS